MKRKSPKLSLSRETLREIGLAGGGPVTVTNCRYTCYCAPSAEPDCATLGLNTCTCVRPR